MKIYLASSFAYEDKDKTNTRKLVMDIAEKILVELNHSVYNPSKLKIENAWGYSMYDWGQLVYEADKAEIDSCDVVVFLSYGKENNAGSVWEVGYAAAKNIPVILVSLNQAAPESLMVVHSATACLNNLEELRHYDFVNMPKQIVNRVEN